MLDKDTYKRELVRMWNTLRDDRYKKGADERDVVNCYFLDCEVDND